MLNNQVIKKIIEPTKYSHTPIISIIIPTKNSEYHLQNCLTSIINQTYTNIETIIIDNYSTDTTKTIALQNKTKFYQLKGNAATARNYGIKKTNGKYTLLLDVDQKILPNMIQKSVETFQKTNIDAIIFPEKSIVKSIWSKTIALEHTLIAQNSIFAMPRFFKTEVLKKLGEDENIVFGEDWDLYLRFKEQGFKTKIVKEHILHTESNLLSKILIKNYFYGFHFRTIAKKHGAKIFRRYTIFPFPIKKILTHFKKEPKIVSAYIILRILRITFFLIGVTTRVFRKDIR